MKFKDINEAVMSELDMDRQEVSGYLDKAAQGLRIAEQAMEKAVKVKLPLSNSTIPMKKSLAAVQRAKKAVIGIRL